jgi:hypothetical protein
MNRLREALKRPGAGLALASGAVALLSVLSLAWVVPPFGAVVRSDAYRVGYNSAVAVAGMLAAVVLAALGGLRASRSARTGAAEVEAAADVADEAAAETFAETSAETPAGRGRGLAIDTALLAAGLVGATVAFSYFTWGVPFADHLYFFTRYAYALQGAAPYSAFDFPYGPVLLYVPVVLFRALGSGGTGVALLAYYASVALEHAVGALLLGYSLGRLPMAPARRRALFWVVGAFALLGSWSGPNYTLLRFAAPLAAIVLLERADARAPRTRAGALRGGLLAILVVAATASISPDMAAAVFVAAVAMAIRVVARGERTAWWSLLLLAAVPATALVAPAGVGVLLTDFASGVLNLPVLPSPFVLIYIASVVVAAFGAGRGFLTAGGSSGLLVGLASAGVVLVAPALGRADIGHVFWNALPALAAAAIVLAAWPGRWFKVYAAGLGLVFIVGLVPLLVINAAPLMVGAASESRDIRGRETSASWTRLLAADRVAMPFGSVDDLSIAYSLRGALVPMHGDYQGPVNDRQLAAIERDLEQARWVVLPTSSLAYLQWELSTDPASREPQVFEGAIWSALLQFPVHLHERRADYPGMRKLAEVLTAEFAPGVEVGPYVMMERRAAAGKP